MEFIGRDAEMNLLEGCYQNKSSFIGVIYGRRRIGKSRLLSEFIQKKNNLSFEGLEDASTDMQIAHFQEQLARQTGNTLLLKSQIPNWNRAFDILTDIILAKSKKEHLVIVFDEIQWMASQRTQLISLIKYYWDNQWKQHKVSLLLCGSIASFMVKKVIRSKALYGRIDLELKLQQLRPNEATLFLRKRSLHESLLYQMILGRVPKYLEHVDPRKSFEMNINQICFQSNGIMVNEIDKIFYSQFKKSSLYARIVTCLFSGPKTMNEIAIYLKIKSGGGLKEYLTNLELAQYIGSDVSIDKKSNSKYKRYFLTDEFLLFYKKFMEPNKNQIQKNQDLDLFSKLIKPKWSPWLGLAFERFCMNNANYLSQKMGFQDYMIGYGPYHQKDPGLQIDLLFQRSDKVIVLCEMKYSDQLISKEIIPQIQSKIDRLRSFKGYTIEKALITTCGADKSLTKEKYFDYVLTTEDLVG